MKQVFVIQLQNSTLKALPITDLAKAKQLERDYKKMKWQDQVVDIRGVMSEQDFKTLVDTFWHVPAFDQLKKNAEYFKKYGHWPK